MNKLVFVKNLFFSILGCLLISGCATGLVVEGLGAAEIAAIGRSASLTGEYGLAVRGSSLVVAEESLFFSRLRRVKMENPALNKTPRLYITENGTNTYFGIVEKGNEIKLTNFIDRIITLPEGSSLFRVKKKANVRIGPGKNYSLYKHNGIDIAPLSENQVILVLRPVGEWYEVQLGKNKNEVGYILASLLVSAAGNSNVDYQNVSDNIYDQAKFNSVYELALEQFNYLYTGDNLNESPPNAQALQDTLSELLKYAIALDNGTRAKILMIRHIYNIAADYQVIVKKIDGLKLDAINKRNYYKNLFLIKIDEGIRYGEEVISSLENLTYKKPIDESNYKIILDFLLEFYSVKGNLEKVDELKFKRTGVSRQ